MLLLLLVLARVLLAMLAWRSWCARRGCVLPPGLCAPATGDSGHDFWAGVRWPAPWPWCWSWRLWMWWWLLWGDGTTSGGRKGGWSPSSPSPSPLLPSVADRLTRPVFSATVAVTALPPTVADSVSAWSAAVGLRIGTPRSALLRRWCLLGLLSLITLSLSVRCGVC